MLSRDRGHGRSASPSRTACRARRCPGRGRAAGHEAGAARASRSSTRDETDVLVLNGGGVTGAAGTAADGLRARGYQITSVGNAKKQSSATRTLVMFRPATGPRPHASRATSTRRSSRRSTGCDRPRSWARRSSSSSGTSPRHPGVRTVRTDDEALHAVVGVATDVPLAVERLLVPGFVARADAELVATERHVPVERPRRPRPRRIDVVLDAAVLHVSPPSTLTSTTRHPRPTRPGAPAHAHGRGSRNRSREWKSGTPGGTASARGAMRVERHALGHPRRAAAGSRSTSGSLRTAGRERVDPREPLDARHSVPAGDEQAQWKAVLRRQRRAVQLVCEKHLVAASPPTAAGCAGSSARPLSSRPRSRPVKTTSRRRRARRLRRARRAGERRGHAPVPTASCSHGWLSTCGARPARPLPAHSIVATTSTEGRARSSSSDSVERTIDLALDDEAPAQSVHGGDVVVDRGGSGGRAA